MEVTSIIKMGFEEMGIEGIDWILLAENRDKWWAVVYAVMSLKIPPYWWDFFASVMP
jgi:hypothetical protein